VFVFCLSCRTQFFLNSKRRRSACSRDKGSHAVRQHCRHHLWSRCTLKLHLCCVFLDITASVFLLKLLYSLWYVKLYMGSQSWRYQKRTSVSFKVIVIGKLSSMRSLSRIYNLRRRVLQAQYMVSLYQFHTTVLQQLVVYETQNFMLLWNPKFHPRLIFDVLQATKMSIVGL
jgi:hypothetical protein